MSIRCVIFDWGGTLARSGTRQDFLYSPCSKKRLSVLHRDVIPTLKWLRRNNYYIGIISNTQHGRDIMIRSLRETSLHHYFDFVVLSSESHLCRKPCSKIFLEGLRILNQQIKEFNLDQKVHPSECLYVGNNFMRDVIGANKIGMKTAYRVNNRIKSEEFLHLVDMSNGKPDHFIRHISDLITLFTLFQKKC